MLTGYPWPTWPISRNFVAGLEFNGDGVISAARIADKELRATVEDIIKCHGPVADLGGDPGINQETSDAFFSDVEAHLRTGKTRRTAMRDIRFLGDKTRQAADAFHAVKEKVNDYFTRCGMAAYDIRAAIPLSRSAEDYQASPPKPYRRKSADIANFPLATVEADKPLPLVAGINPAWQKQIEALREHTIVPLLGKKESLSAAQWTTLSARFEAFEAWQAAEPAGDVEQLGVARLREIAASHHREAIGELIEWINRWQTK